MSNKRAAAAGPPGRLASVARGRSLAAAASVAVVVAFLAIGLVQRYPYQDAMTVQNSGGDDWWSYRENAVSVIEGGLHIPRVSGVYSLPGGFLYNYFVAAVFAVFGANTEYVIVLQYVMVALSCVLLYWFARRYLLPELSLAYLVTCAILSWLQLGDWIVRLLSENLAIVLFPAALLLLASAIERSSRLRCAGAGAVTGALILTRPNMVGVVVLFTLVIIAYHRGALVRVERAVTFLVGVAAICALLPLRNAFVTGTVAASTYGDLLPTGSAAELALSAAKRLVYCFGVFVGGPTMTGSGVGIGKRWLLLNLVALVATVVLLVRGRFDVPDALCVAIIVAAYVPFALLPVLGGYGMRFQYPYGGVLLFLAFRLLDILKARARSEAR